MFDEATVGGAERFVALLRSQGSYQGLIKAGLTDDDIGVPAFEAARRAPSTPRRAVTCRCRSAGACASGSARA